MVQDCPAISRLGSKGFMERFVVNLTCVVEVCSVLTGSLVSCPSCHACALSANMLPWCGGQVYGCLVGLVDGEVTVHAGPIPGIRLVASG